MMKKINKSISTLFWFALGLSVGFPLGILGIVFGAIKGLWVLLIAGILLTVGGFYVMPLLWVRYGERRQDRNILEMILKDHVYTIDGLAKQTGYQVEMVRERVKKMILSRELVGFLLVDDKLELNVNEKQTAEPKKNKCECCGAMMTIAEGQFTCEYCGAVLKIE